MTDRSGTFGRPRTDDDLPPAVEQVRDAYIRGENTDEDWHQLSGYIVLRLWVDPSSYEVVVARVIEESELVEAT